MTRPTSDGEGLCGRPCVREATAWTVGAAGPSRSVGASVRDVAPSFCSELTGDGESFSSSVGAAGPLPRTTCLPREQSSVETQLSECKPSARNKTKRVLILKLPRQRDIFRILWVLPHTSRELNKTLEGDWGKAPVTCRYCDNIGCAKGSTADHVPVCSMKGGVCFETANIH